MLILFDISWSNFPTPLDDSGGRCTSAAQLVLVEGSKPEATPKRLRRDKPLVCCMSGRQLLFRVTWQRALSESDCDFRDCRLESRSPYCNAPIQGPS